MHFGKVVFVGVSVGHDPVVILPDSVIEVTQRGPHHVGEGTAIINVDNAEMVQPTEPDGDILGDEPIVG